LRFIDDVHFIDGGTGRFVHAGGSATGLIDGVVATAAYDGTIRYGRTE